MGRPAEKYVVYNLRETYHELGKYEFKVVLSPKFFKNSHECELLLQDSDGKPIRNEVQKWGRKINCSFVLDETVADGVSQALLKLSGDKGEVRITFWVIKP